MRWEEEISSHLCEIEDLEDPRAEASETRPLAGPNWGLRLLYDHACPSWD
jgi:hypothetical protein